MVVLRATKLPRLSVKLSLLERKLEDARVLGHQLGHQTTSLLQPKRLVALNLLGNLRSDNQCNGGQIKMEYNTISGTYSVVAK